MLKHKVWFVFAALLMFAGFFAHADDNFTGQAPPVTVGASCNGSDVTYVNWRTETKTPWHSALLIAVPDGYSPSDWDGADAFETSFNESVGENKQLSTKAGALLSAWDQSFQSSARLYAVFERSVSTEARDVECSNGIWSIPDGSHHISTQTDASEWVRIVPDAVSRSAISAQDVEDHVNQVLTNVNSQPGADTRPHHSYTASTP